MVERGALVFVDYGLDARGFADRPEGTRMAVTGSSPAAFPRLRGGCVSAERVVGLPRSNVELLDPRTRDGTGDLTMYPQGEGFHRDRSRIPGYDDVVEIRSLDPRYDVVHRGRW